MRPLEGTLVLDLSRYYPGPFATSLLAALGARVVKVEDPRTGDPARLFPPEDEEGHGFAFTPVNRGKESVALDTRAPEGVEAVRRLAARADVVVESFRPGVLARVGLGPEDLLGVNPRIVVLSLVGYAQDGPLADAPGHDLNYQALAGLVAPPAMPRAQVADVAGAMYGATAVLAALLERARTGRGRALTVSLAESAVAFNAMTLARAVLPGEPELTGALPAYALYRCADDRWVALGALEPKFWEAFVRASGLERIQDDGFAIGDLDARLRVEAAFAARPSQEWLALCAKAGVPCTLVLAPAEAARAAPRTGPAAGLGLEVRASAPRHGEHTRAVLREVGYDDGAIADLARSGAAFLG